MITFKARRRRLSLVTLAVAAVIIPLLLAWSLSLHDIAFVSGWTLLSLVIVLTLFNVRKKLTYPPLFKSSTWLQLHVYVGYLAILVFFFHTGARLPRGLFESVLYALFLLLALSGIVGLYLSRSVPNSLADRGSEVIFERIPRFRRELSDRAKALVLQSIEKHGSSILSDFYSMRLADFMSRPQHLGAHLIRSERPRQQILHDLEALDRYLSESEREIARELTSLIGQKDDLDFHYTRQGILKLWLFAHIPLTYMLLIFLVAHVVLVYAFAGTIS
ncbi:MAG: hypothetical protein KDI19_09940 [Pseudomonadales bacterium]|nr:hypothetical protein [Pseudomonadales bacterium]